MTTQSAGTLALVGGGEFTAAARALDADLLAASGSTEVLVVPTAAAYERPAARVEAAREYFASLGAQVAALEVYSRHDAEDRHREQLKAARFIYLMDGSPLHLRSVLKDTPLYDALLAAYHDGAVLAASGAGATLLGDPMVDPRGGAYTVGLGLASGVAVFPYHGTTAPHLWQRSKDLLPSNAVLVGLDEGTAIVRAVDGTWRVDGEGRVTVFRRGGDEVVIGRADALAPLLA